jgi:hypothetical protein
VRRFVASSAALALETSLASLQHAIRQFMAHYHAERNHQGLENPPRAAQPNRRIISAGAAAPAARWHPQLLLPRRCLSGLDSISGQNEVGMYGWIAVVIFGIFGHELPKSDPVLWFMMQIAMLAGFLTSYPVNCWLIRAGIKDAHVARDKVTRQPVARV